MNADIVTMISNLSQALMPARNLIAGLGYLLGLLLMIAAIGKLKKIGDMRARGGSNERMFVPIAYILGAAALLFLPSSIQVLSYTAFGESNVLQYSPYQAYNIYDAMRVIIKTAGLIWFIRGCILLVHASEPGVQHGPKGLAFLCAGVLAMNFEATIGILNYIMDQLMAFMDSSSK